MTKIHSLQKTALATYVLLAPLGITATAQQPVQTVRRDTLQREVTVVTDKVVSVEKHKPRSYAYEFEEPKVTRLKPIPPKPTGDFTPEVTIPSKPLFSKIAAELPESKHNTFLRSRFALLPIYSMNRSDAIIGGSYDWQEKGNLSFLIDHDWFRNRDYFHSVEGPRSWKDYLTYGFRSFSTATVQYTRPYNQSKWYVGLEGAFLTHTYRGLHLDPLRTQSFVPSRANQLGNVGTYIGVNNLKWGPLSWDIEGYYRYYNKQGVSFVHNEATRTWFLGHLLRTGLMTQVQSEWTDNWGWKINAQWNLSHLMDTGTNQEEAAHGMAAQHQHMVAEVIPQITFQDFWDEIRLDASAGVGIASIFTLSPSMRVVLYPQFNIQAFFPRRISMYLSGRGGGQDLDPLRLEQTIRYTLPSLNPLPTATHLDLQLGVRYNAADLFSCSLYGGTKLQSNKPYFLYTYRDIAGEEYPQQLFYNTIGGYGTLHDHYIGATTGLRLWDSRVRFDASAEYHFLKGDENLPVISEPTWRCSGMLSVLLGKRWNIVAHSTLALPWQMATYQDEVINVSTIDADVSLQWRAARWATLMTAWRYSCWNNKFYTDFSPHSLNIGVQLHF